MTTPGTIDPDAFNTFERAGWAEVVAPYADAFGGLTTQAIAPLLDALGAGAGVRLLDVACGPGWLTAEAARRGAAAVGLDASTGMVSEAKRRHPSLDFREGDAEDLAFADAEFDAVGINFGLLHLGRPDRALAEAYRVLRGGGRVGFTVWAPPDEAIFFGILLDAIRAHGRLDVPIPPGPPFFRFSDRAESKRTLAAVGFVAAEVRTLPQVWRVSSPEALFAVAMDATVRTRGLLQAQTPPALGAIREAVIDAADAYRTPRGVEMPMPAVLSWAAKP